MLNCAHNILKRMHNLHVAYIQRMSNLCLTYKNDQIVGPLRRMTTYTTVL